MGLGRLRHAGLARCRLAARMIGCFTTGGASSLSGRAGPAYGGHHQRTALACHRTRVRHARQHDHRSESHARALPARRRFALSPFFARLAKKCRAVDGPATLAANLARAFQVFLQGRQLRSPPRSHRLTQQLLVEKSRNQRVKLQLRDLG